MTITALDLFAGTGWGVAARWLGIREMGVEIMPEACSTREANHGRLSSCIIAKRLSQEVFDLGAIA